VLSEDGDVLEDRDQGVKSLPLLDSEDRLLVGAALAGKLSFAWWSAVGDDFHVNPDEADLGRKAAFNVQRSDRLLALASAVRDAGKTAAFVSKNNDGYINVRWTAVRSATDEFDRSLLAGLGLLDHWRALNIWYRQCMRSTRSNYNSRLLTPQEIGEYLQW